MWTSKCERWLAVALWTLIVGTLAQPAVAQENESGKLTPAKYLRSISVRIRNKTVPIFQGVSSNSSEGIGTGFIVEHDKERGRIYIFTNDHVVSSAISDIQKITVEVVGEGRALSKEVDAEIEMISPIHDFAVLSVNAKALLAIKPNLQIARIPARDSDRYQAERNPLALQELPTKAYGYPLGVDHNLTSGTITSAQFKENGLHLITETPINPGNSGGPLIVDDNSFEVLGMNTAIYRGANSMGFVIPIGVIYEEYLKWKSTAKKPTQKGLRAVLSGRAWFELKLIKMSNGQSVEEFLKNSTEVPLELRSALEEEGGVLMVEHAHEAGSQLGRGDLILAVNGYVVGDNFYLMRRALDALPPGARSTSMIILRNGELLEIQERVNDESFHFLKTQVDFVYFSGLLFSEWPIGKSWAAYGPHRVYIRDIVTSRSTRAMEGLLPNPGSIVTGVTISGTYSAVNRLGDLRRALQLAFLNSHLEKKEAPTSLILHVRKSISYASENGTVQPLFDSLGMPLTLRFDTGYALPLDEVLTPSELSLRQLRKGADLDPRKAKTVDWRHQANGFLGCAESLERIEKRSARNRQSSEN